jgi:hypothetical protein
MMKTKALLEQLIAEAVAKRAPKRGSKAEKLLYQIFAWQTIAKHAEELLKRSWAAAQPVEVPDDDFMRALGRGEHIVTEAGAFTCIANITAPRMLLNQDDFNQAVSKRYEIDIAELLDLAEACKTEGKPPLSKRVLEA